MRSDVIIYMRNHCFTRTDISMKRQGFDEYEMVTIGDDIWIRGYVIILPASSFKTNP